jgi:hypothetical protein
MNSLSLAVGFIPLVIVAGALIIVGVLYVLKRLTATDLDEILESLVYFTGSLLGIMLIVRFLCMNIQPTERFADADPEATLMSDIAAAEKAVCGYMTRADGFIQSRVGKAGTDNPDLVVQAQNQARAGAGGPITDCSGTAVADLDEAENRIARLEFTLNGFTAPVFQEAYKSTNTCESFADSRLTDLQTRIATVKQLISFQKQKFLDPIDQKQAAMQRGEVSDCDKNRGGNTSADVAGGKKPN